MKLAAVAIWYNPQKDEDLVLRVLSYAGLVKTYIVDNSPCDHADLAAQIPGAVYLPNFKNIGIAAAQNRGCKQAFKDGYEWVMTMDQDSCFGDGQFERYIHEAENYALSDEKSVSFSVCMLDSSSPILPLTLQIRIKIKTLFVKYFGYTPRPVPTKEAIDHPDRVYASANIVKLSVWNEVGGFDEALFIDEVDFDFCIRLQMAGYRITRFNTLYLNHKLGNRRLSVFPKETYHTGIRLFYIIRNKFIENRRYRFIIKHNYRKDLFRYFKDYCILDWRAVRNWGIFLHAYFAYKDFIKTDSTFLKLKEKGLAR